MREDLFTQDRRDREYEAACAKWIEGASPELLERLEAMGLLRSVKGARVLAHVGDEAARDTCLDADAAEIFDNVERVSVHIDVAAAVDVLPEVIAEKFGVDLETAVEIAKWHVEMVLAAERKTIGVLLHRIIGLLLLPGQNLLISAHGLAHAAQMAAAAGFPSMRASAEYIGFSPEAVRRAAWRWQEALNLPRLPGAKSEEARAAYSQDKKTNHWRNQKCKPAPLSKKAPRPQAQPGS